jgi:hypothetical protein
VPVVELGTDVVISQEVKALKGPAYEMVKKVVDEMKKKQLKKYTVTTTEDKNKEKYKFRAKHSKDKTDINGTISLKEVSKDASKPKTTVTVKITGKIEMGKAKWFLGGKDEGVKKKVEKFIKEEVKKRLKKEGLAALGSILTNKDAIALAVAGRYAGELRRYA